MKTDSTKRPELDWLNLRGRLQRALTASEDAHRLSPERVRAILEARARAAAQMQIAPLAADATVEVVRFQLGAECYAIATSCVREILTPLPPLGKGGKGRVDIVPLPDTVDFLLGVINLRGQIVAILDLRQFFGIPGQEVTERTRVIVLGQARIEFGLIADAVEEVALLPLDEIRQVPASTPSSVRDWLRGVTASAQLVLDGPALLKDPRLYVDRTDDGAF